MSYTFSRRDFMKYTALTAVAVASAGMFTGCGGNPNQPSAVYNVNNDSALTFGGSSGGFLGIGASHDKHVLKAGASYTVITTGTLVCDFEHTPVSEGTSDTFSHYQLRYIDADGTARYVSPSSSFVAAGGGEGLKANETSKVTLTICNLDNNALQTAKNVYIQYFPRHNALGNENDAYSDVYATWDITSIIQTV